MWSKVLITNYSDSEPVFRMMRITRPGTARRSDSHLAVISSGMDFISDPAIERADTVGQQPGYLFHEMDGIDGGRGRPISGGDEN